MFEAVETGRTVDKETFRAEVDALRTLLVPAQHRLKKAKERLILIVSGVEGAGKSEVVNRLSGWADTRGLRTHAFFEETQGERLRPHDWRFWRRLPPRGSIGIFFGSWYTQPIVDRVLGKIEEAEFEQRMRRVAELEATLARDGVRFVKLWFHLPHKEQIKRLKTHFGEEEEKGKKAKGKKGDKKAKDEKKGGKKGKDKKKGDKKAKDKKKGDKKAKDRKKGDKSELERRIADLASRYEAFLPVAERAIRLTDTAQAPWQLVEASCKRARDLSAGQALLAALEAPAAEPEAACELTPLPAEAASILASVDLGQRLEREDYEEELDALRERLRGLAWDARERRLSLIAAFEGWDAAGKGGAIRRTTSGMDARLYSVVPIAAPSSEELAQHYLWRFWRRIPRDGHIRIFDRSWYGRVLVERVEGFATEAEWKRAYAEINTFEAQLTEHGSVLLKFWLHVSPDEQLRRFREREATPYKRHKITPDDWRNREKWDAYEVAVNEMVARTSTSHAPWTLVAANDKLHARITVMRTVVERLEAALE